ALHTHISSPAPATPEIYTLSLHDALPISVSRKQLHQLVANDRKRFLELRRPVEFVGIVEGPRRHAGDQVRRVLHRMRIGRWNLRSEEHTSELQSPYDIVCRLLLEKKKK